jgi:phage gp29-like protein
MRLLDQYGQPIKPADLKQAQTERLSNIRSLQSEHDAHPARGLTPQRIHSILRQAEQGDLIAQLELAGDMEERDTQIFTELNKRKSGLLKLDWDVVAAEDASAAEQRHAEQVKAWIRGFKGFKRSVLMHLLDGIFKGFAAIEMVWAM